MKRNVVELVVLGVSVLAIVILVGTLLVEGLTESRPTNPSVELHEDRARQGATGWILPATLRNEGDEAAEQVVIEASAEIDGATEVSRLVIEFLPAGTAVQGSFAFSAQPRAELGVRLVSFVSP